MGDVPERTTFEQPDTRVPLRPYLRLTQAVRRGRLDQYEATVREDSTHFEQDGTMSLVLRWVSWYPCPAIRHGSR